ncbi:hypothetical protein JW766_03185 [Candidatus Dojkabacteria bacterium]|nr:hypothetical protein [Candidatus Dojkabacteria bacterium]
MEAIAPTATAQDIRHAELQALCTEVGVALSCLGSFLVEALLSSQLRKLRTPGQGFHITDETRYIHSGTTSRSPIELTGWSSPDFAHSVLNVLLGKGLVSENALVEYRPQLNLDH